MQWRSDHACIHSDNGHIQNLCNFSLGAARTRKEWDVFVVLSGLNPDFY